MKLKFIIPLICAILIGFLLGKFMFNQYDSKTSLKTVFNDKSKSIYFIQQGVYSSKESMETNVSNFTSYIYDVKDNKYYVYVGMTGNKENVSKLEGYFKKMGYDIYVKEFNIDNNAFLESLSQYDELLLQTSDEKAIKTIENQVLSKYEELIQNGESTH